MSLSPYLEIKHVIPLTKSLCATRTRSRSAYIVFAKTVLNEKYLRLGQKECPKCRVKVSLCRDLHVDPAFDKIIQTFYPDMDVYEAIEKQVSSDGISESHPIATAIEEGLFRQVLQKKLRVMCVCVCVCVCL